MQRLLIAGVAGLAIIVGVGWYVASSSSTTALEREKIGPWQQRALDLKAFLETDPPVTEECDQKQRSDIDMSTNEGMSALADWQGRCWVLKFSHKYIVMQADLEARETRVKACEEDDIPFDGVKSPPRGLLRPSEEQIAEASDLWKRTSGIVYLRNYGVSGEPLEPVASMDPESFQKAQDDYNASSTALSKRRLACMARLEKEEG